MRRVISVWLPLLPTDRLRQLYAQRRDELPLDVPLAIAGAGNVRRIIAVDRAARRAGVSPGATVTDALAVAPHLVLAAADPAADGALLEHLADWCGHYTPWSAVDTLENGVWLDITGCDHLFGGEQALLRHLTGRLGKLGFTVRAGLADTPGAAWAQARFGTEGLIPPKGQREALTDLPVAALRLMPATAQILAGLGLRRVGDLYGVARAAMAARFGREVAHRLDQALGVESEPLSPRQPPPSHRLHAAFAEPIGRSEDVAEAVRRLLVQLCDQLAGERLGLRRLEVTAFRVDSSAKRVVIGTGRPVRDPKPLLRLLAEKLDGLDAGFGIEMLRLSALEVGTLAPEQSELAPAERDGGVGPLLDTLANRLGADQVVRLAPRQSHLPERAQQAISPHAALPDLALPGPAWPPGRRPLRLFPQPEPVEAIAPVPDSPPLMFRWRNRTHKITRADGAERIAAEWWRQDAPERDYYLVEDEAGRRFWLYREGPYGADPPPRWFLHGMFG